MLLPYLQKGDKASFKHGLGVMATWLQFFPLLAILKDSLYKSPSKCFGDTRESLGPSQ